MTSSQLRDKTGQRSVPPIAVSGARADAFRTGQLHMQSWSRRTGAAAELAVSEAWVR